MSPSIAELRTNYSKKKLSEKSIKPDPIIQFGKWWEEAVKAKLIEPNAMILATASAEGLPSARTVLLKGFSEKGFLFFTNYNSQKGHELEDNPRACLVFLWKELERQVRITGTVSKSLPADSDVYFHSRPRDSQFAAIASPQSQVIESREWLDGEFKKIKAKVKKGITERPQHWGGFIVRPLLIEFWQGRLNRLHDRILYTPDARGGWRIERLAP